MNIGFQGNADTSTSNFVGVIYSKNDNHFHFFENRENAYAASDDIPGDTTLQHAPIYTGDIVSSGTLTTSSDLRIKKNVKPMETQQGLQLVQQLKPVTYQRKDTEQHFIGFIAQDILENVTIEAKETIVKYSSPKDEYSVNYQCLVASLTKAIQEQQMMIDNLQRRLTELEQKK